MNPNPALFQPRWSRSVVARVAAAAIVTAMAALATGTPVRAAVASDLLAGYAAQAGAAAAPARGQQFFAASHGRDWSCASCHGAQPTTAGKHAATAKPIGALAPAFNAERFTDAAKVEKWFRRNCNDVLGRECSAGEKADVLSWLLTLKP